MQLPAEQTSLEPHPHRAALDGPRASHVSQSKPHRRDGSRFASEPVPAQRPEDDRSPGAWQRSKQVAGPAVCMSCTGSCSIRHCS